jgi:phosphatidylinositol alpha-1,6-mannosyltransferase
VTDRVHLLGHVAPEDLPRWLNAADVFAMPNREIDGDNEGFGMVFLEAAACGKPVLAGRDGGTGSAVVDGVTGLRVDGKSEQAVVDGLARLLSDAALAERMAQAALARAREAFSWESVARRTMEAV